MHTARLTDDDGRDWVVLHNGDWSGEAHVRRLDNNDKTVEEYTIPGRVIAQACGAAVVSAAIAMLEQWDGSDRAAHDAIDGMRQGERRR